MNSQTSIQATDNHIYFNVAQFNNTDIPQPAILNETRTDPFLAKANEYNIAVVRFSIPTFGVPLIRLEDTNITSPYKVWIGDINGVAHYEDEVIFSADTLSSYTDLVESINQSLFGLFNLYKLTYPAIPPTTPPYMVYDAKTSLFSMVGEDAYVYTGVNTLIVGMNSRLYNLFNNFYEFTNVVDDPDFPDHTIVFYKNGINSISTKTGIPGVQMLAEYPNFSEVNALNSIVITTNTLPITAEYISLPGSQGDNLTSQVLTDFEPSVEVAGSSRSVLQYFANPYRYIELNSTQELRKLNLAVYWTDKLGNLQPLYILPKQSLSIKLMFKRKNLSY